MAALTAAGWPAARIAHLLGVHPQTVSRIRAACAAAKPPRDPEPKGLTRRQLREMLREYTTDPNLTPEERDEALDYLDGLARAQNPAGSAAENAPPDAARG